MFTYTVNTKKGIIEFNASSKTLNIGDARFPFKKLRNVYKLNQDGTILRDKKNEIVYLHPNLNWFKMREEGFFEKHKDDMVCKTNDGEILKVKDFYEPCYNAVSLSFLNQLTLQISKILMSKIGSCINDKSFLTVHDNFCIKQKGFSYLYLSIGVEMPYNYLGSLDGLVIKWRSKKPEVEYVEMSQDVDENSIEFLLCSREEEKEILNIKFSGDCDYMVGALTRLEEHLNHNNSSIEENSIYFEDFVEANNLTDLPNYPDVFIKLYFHKSVDSLLQQKATTYFNEFINEYNSSNKEGIHFANCLEPPKTSKEKCLIFHVDFGSANPTALLNIIEFLSAKKEIFQISIK